MIHLSALMIITLNLTTTQLKKTINYLMTLLDKKRFRYFTVIFVVWRKINSFCKILYALLRQHQILLQYQSKINENTSANLNIPGYAFVNINSKTQVGGVCLHLSNDLEFSRRSDLDISGDGIESCWKALARTTKKTIVIRSVYMQAPER